MKCVHSIGLLGVLITWFSAVSVSAATYYVDNIAGSDSTSGTSSAAPWKSLSKVNNTSFKSGDTINFKRGSVWQGTLRVKSNGTSAAPITYQAYGTGKAPHIKTPGVSYGHSIEVTGDYNIISGFYLTDAHEAGIILWSGADRNVIRDNEITASGHGVIVVGQFNLITRNYAHDLKMVVNTPGGDDDYGGEGFSFHGPNNELSYNRCINCRTPSYDYGYDGGFVSIWNSGDNTYIHHNYAENTEGFFEIGGNSGPRTANNVRVAHNILVNTGAVLCTHPVGANFGMTVTNLRIEHNTVIKTSAWGYQAFICTTDFSYVRLRNNIFSTNTPIAPNGNFTHTHNLYHMNGASVGYSLGPGEKTGNPLFVNLAAKDFHLQAGSPAIDAGLNLSYTQDLEDKIIVVGAAPDMGAYEYEEATSILLPRPKLDLLH